MAAFKLLTAAMQYVNHCLLRHKEVPCPCCNQKVKASRRRISKSMGIVLSLLGGHRDKNGDKYVHVNRLLRRKKVVDNDRDWSRLKHWGFIEERMSTDGDGRGFWRITDAGIDFLDGKTTAAKVKYTYNKGVVAIPVSVNPEVAVMININQVMASENFNVNDYRTL